MSDCSAVAASANGLATNSAVGGRGPVFVCGGVVRGGGLVPRWPSRCRHLGGLCGRWSVRAWGDAGSGLDHDAGLGSAAASVVGLAVWWPSGLRLGGPFRWGAVSVAPTVALAAASSRCPRYSGSGRAVGVSRPHRHRPTSSVSAAVSVLSPVEAVAAPAVPVEPRPNPSHRLGPGGSATGRVLVDRGGASAVAFGSGGRHRDGRHGKHEAHPLR